MPIPLLRPKRAYVVRSVHQRDILRRLPRRRAPVGFGGSDGVCAAWMEVFSRAIFRVDSRPGGAFEAPPRHTEGNDRVCILLRPAMVSRRHSSCRRRQVAGAHSEWVAYVLHCDGADGTKCVVGIGSLWLSGNRCDRVAAPGSRGRCSCPALRGSDVQQISLEPDGHSAIQVGVVESERSASSDLTRNDAV